MNRKEAIQAIVKEIGTSPIVSANGYISRDLYETHDRKENFYMIGSMGLASSIALGVAIKNPKIKVYVFDGDGNILMNLGSLATIGNLKPKNLIHIVFDNHAHESTGGQPTVSTSLDIPKILHGCNYNNVSYIDSKKDLFNILNKPQKGLKGIVVKTKNESREDLGRPDDSLQKTKVRFMDSFKDER